MSSKRMFAVGALVLIHFATPAHWLKRSFNLFNKITRLKANPISFYHEFFLQLFLANLGLIYWLRHAEVSNKELNKPLRTQTVFFSENPW